MLPRSSATCEDLACLRHGGLCCQPRHSKVAKGFTLSYSGGGGHPRDQAGACCGWNGADQAGTPRRRSVHKLQVDVQFSMCSVSHCWRPTQQLAQCHKSHDSVTFAAALQTYANEENCAKADLQGCTGDGGRSGDPLPTTLSHPADTGDVDSTMQKVSLRPGHSTCASATRLRCCPGAAHTRAYWCTSKLRQHSCMSSHQTTMYQDMPCLPLDAVVRQPGCRRTTGSFLTTGNTWATHL